MYCPTVSGSTQRKWKADGVAIAGCPDSFICRLPYNHLSRCFPRNFISRIVVTSAYTEFTYAAVWTNNLSVRPRQIAIARIVDRYTHPARREVCDWRRVVTIQHRRHLYHLPSPPRRFHRKTGTASASPRSFVCPEHRRKEDPERHANEKDQCLKQNDLHLFAPFTPRSPARSPRLSANRRPSFRGLPS